MDYRPQRMGMVYMCYAPICNNCPNLEVMTQFVRKKQKNVTKLLQGYLS